MTDSPFIVLNGAAPESGRSMVWCDLVDCALSTFAGASAPHDPAADRTGLTDAGIAIDESPDVPWDLFRHGVTLHRPGRPAQRVKAAWSGVGATAQAGLATWQDAVPAPDGRIPANDHRQATVPGLFAGGDLTTGLNRSAPQGQVQIAAGRIDSALRLAEGWVLDAPAKNGLRGGGG